MPDFKKFLETINPEDLSKIASDSAANQANAFAGVSQASTAVTLELLRQYHEWLTKQLSELHQK